MRLTLLMTTAVSLTLPTMANSAELDDAPATRLDKVTTTSQKKDTDGLTRTNSVSIITKKDLDRKQAGSVADALRDLPGVDIYGGPNMQGARFSIRGERRQDRQVIQVDGVNQYFEQYRMGSFFGDPELLKSIKVVRGPAGGQFGSGAIAGAISMTTKDASDFLRDGETIGAKVKAGFNTNGNEKNGAVYLYGKPQDNIELLGAFSLRDSDDFNFADGTLFAGSRLSLKNVLLKGSVELADFHKVTASFQHLSSSALAEFRVADRGIGFDEGFVQRDLTSTQATIKYEYNDPDNDFIDLNVLFGYTKTRNFETGLAPSDLYNVANLDEGEERFSHFKGYQITINNKSRFYGEDVSQTLTYGIQYNYRDRQSADERQLLNPNFDIVLDPVEFLDGQFAPSQMYFQPNGQQKVFTAFIQDEITLYDRLTLTPALSYNSYRLSGETDGWVDQLPPAEWFADYGAETNFSPSISADLKVVEWFHLIGGYYTGFRGPTVDNVYSAWARPNRVVEGVSAPRYRNTSLQLMGETAKSFELGARIAASGLFSDDDALRARLVYFHNEISDRITAPGGYGATIAENHTYHINSGMDRYKGWEAEVAYYQGPTYVRMSYSTVTKDLIVGDVMTPGTDTPANQFVISAGTLIDALNLDIGFRSEFVSEVSPERAGSVDPYPGYNSHDLYLTWTPETLEGFELQLTVTNLTNNDYQQFRAGSRTWGRDFRLRASYQF